jgi:2-polyprenyl-3-methyl-5-hydroxy-6-metoxy-1,4-benzoquinol methylase
MSTRARSRVEKAWDRNARVWSEHINDGTDLVRRYLIEPGLARALGDIRGRRVLDAGCGEGLYSRWLAKRGARVTGVDFSKALIDIARAEEERRPLGIRYRVGDLMARGGMGREKFDVVVACQVVMALPDHRRAIRELARVLRPGGQLLLVLNHPCFLVPLDDNYFAGRTVWWKFFEGQVTSTALYHRTLESYVSALGAAGLAVTNLFEPRSSAAAARRFEDLKAARSAAIVLIVEARHTRVPRARARRSA